MLVPTDTMQKITLIFFLAFSSCVTAQDWNAWSYEYQFNLENSERSNFRLDSFAVFVDVPFQNRSLMLSKMSFNDSTQTHSIRLDYGCISCGFSGAKFPSTVLLMLYFTDKTRDYSEKGFRNHDYRDRFTVLLPITCEEFEPFATLTVNEIQLGKIQLDRWLYNEHFVGIHVDKNGEANYYTKGTYPFPTTEKLIQIRN